MTTPPPLTDKPALIAHRARAAHMPDHDSAMFLHRLALDDVQERLIEVNRTFTTPAIISGFPAIWRKFPGASHVADADTLDLAPGAHDLVIHAIALHWADDPLGQLVQCRRALQPDGLFLGVLLGGRTLHELRSSLAEAEAVVTGGLSPRVLPMAEIRDLGGLMQRAGFALPVADSFTQTVEYPDFKSLCTDLRGMGETSALAARLRRFTRRAVFAAAEAMYHRHFATPAGKLTATFDLIFLTGWAPHDSQQQPLRPGSARQRLSQALGVSEEPLPKGG
jgi:SAM-dependent methyltransferase